MFLVCDKFTYLHRLCFPGQYDTGKQHLTTNHQGGSPILLHWSTTKLARLETYGMDFHA